MTDKRRPGPPWSPRSGPDLDALRRHALLTTFELWLSYLGLGGGLRLDELGERLSGTGELSTTDHNTVVHALNEHFGDVGEDGRVSYAPSPG